MSANDGSVTATWKLGDTVEFKSWILSFGQWAEVLAPEELRSEIHREVALMSKFYS